MKSILIHILIPNLTNTFTLDYKKLLQLPESELWKLYNSEAINKLADYCCSMISSGSACDVKIMVFKFIYHDLLAALLSSEDEDRSIVLSNLLTQCIKELDNIYVSNNVPKSFIIDTSSELTKKCKVCIQNKFDSMGIDTTEGIDMLTSSSNEEPGLNEITSNEGTISILKSFTKWLYQHFNSNKLEYESLRKDILTMAKNAEQTSISIIGEFDEQKEIELLSLNIVTGILTKERAKLVANGENSNVVDYLLHNPESSELRLQLFELLSKVSKESLVEYKLNKLYDALAQEFSIPEASENAMTTSEDSNSKEEIKQITKEIMDNVISHQEDLKAKEEIKQITKEIMNNVISHQEDLQAKKEVDRSAKSFVDSVPNSSSLEDSKGKEKAMEEVERSAKSLVDSVPNSSSLEDSKGKEKAMEEVEKSAKSFVDSVIENSLNEASNASDPKDIPSIAEITLGEFFFQSIIKQCPVSFLVSIVVFLFHIIRQPYYYILLYVPKYRYLLCGFVVLFLFLLYLTLR